MKTLDQIASMYKSKTLDGRDTSHLDQFIPFYMFIPFDMLDKFDIEPKGEYNSPEKWNETVKPFTRENILKQLERDVDLGFEEALRRGGISAGIMYSWVQLWNWILEEGLEDFDSYDQYGLPLFKATAEKYGFHNPIGGMNGDEFIFSSDSDEWFEES